MPARIRIKQTDFHQYFPLIRVLAIFLILLGLSLLVFHHNHSPPPRLPAPETNPFQLLSDTSGTISKVACVVNSARRSPIRNAAATSEIVNALPENTSVILLTNDRDSFTLTPSPNVQLAGLRPNGAYTIWPQDPFLVLAPRSRNATSPTRLLLPAKFDRSDDLELAHTIATLIGADTIESKLLFEGGNIVTSNSEIFIGENTIRMTAAHLGETLSRAAQRFAFTLGKPVIVVGGFPQPIGHLDMMLTPLGDNRLVLADPAAGANLVSSIAKNDPFAITAFEEKCIAEFFGHPAINKLENPSGETIRPPTLRNQTTMALSVTRNLAPSLDTMAHFLAKKGFEVHRIPFFSATPPPQPINPDQNATQQDERPGPTYPTLTYNNVLITKSPNEPVPSVLLPQYGLDALDQAAERTWSKLGYSVIPVPGLHISAMYGGSLRCCAKVLRRTPSPPSSPHQGTTISP
ncbi:MAG: hypothetical protein AAGD22_16175 [Verrucomicrobiota bacterium]